jgi:hypothetical protein
MEGIKIQFVLILLVYVTGAHGTAVNIQTLLTKLRLRVVLLLPFCLHLPLKYAESGMRFGDSREKSSQICKFKISDLCLIGC